MHIHEIRHVLDRRERYREQLRLEFNFEHAQWLKRHIDGFDWRLSKVDEHQLKQARALVPPKLNKAKRMRIILREPLWMWTENEQRFIEREYPDVWAEVVKEATLAKLTR